MSIHIPHTDEGGVFLGESGSSTVVQTRMVLDDGQLQPLPNPPPAVDHDARVLKVRGSRSSVPDLLNPPSIDLESTPETRALREPVRSYLDQNGQPRRYTEWTYQPGESVDVVERQSNPSTIQFFEQLLGYDGSEDEAILLSVTGSSRVTDHHWRFDLTPAAGRVRGTYGGEPAQRTATQYRVLNMSRWNNPQQGVFYLIEEHVQGLVSNVYLRGQLTVGWVNTTGATTVEVTEVLGYEYAPAFPDTALGTYVNAWMTLASHITQWQAYTPPGATPITEIRRIRDPDTSFETDVEVIAEYVTRSAPPPEQVPAVVLRHEWGGAGIAPPPDDPIRFTADGGRVSVTGPRTLKPESLAATEDGPVTLRAYGQTFQSGTWAALRGAPELTEEGTVNWETAVVLHASESTITAVWPSGETDSVTRLRFEREVLRVQAGAFQGFSPVGIMFNTWPPQWAWCVCGNETRAVTVHEAWRDSYKRGAPVPSPQHWSWPTRPRTRPAALPDDAPVAPLGLTLADVTDRVEHDEALARGQTPLLLPLTATARGRDVLTAVVKRMFYAPAQWPEELDDRTSTTGPLTLTYDAPSGSEWSAALLLRLDTSRPVITINGDEYGLNRLGHNAGKKRGWHPYVVQVPAAATYTLGFTGRCSRALLYVGASSADEGPVAD